jgi:hypothetical protein
MERKMTKRSRNILLLVDPHKSIHEVLLEARQLYIKKDVNLHLIYVVNPARSPGLPYRLRKDRRDLQRLVKLYDLSVMSVKVRVGNKDKVLAQEASLLDADIITFPERLQTQHVTLLKRLAAIPA